MSGIINTILFLVLTAALFLFLFSYSARIRDPLNSNRFMLLEGPEMFFILLFATGTLSLSSTIGGHGSDGINLQAIRLFSLEIALFLSLFVCSERPKMSLGIYLYIAYIVWICITLIYCPSIEYGVRYILKYLYPLIIMIAASAIVRDEKVVLSACIWARRVAVISVFFSFSPFLNRLKIVFDNTFWYATALTINYVTISVISFGFYYFYGKDKKDLLLGILFVLPCILMVHRTGILAIFGAIAIFMFLKHKWISLPYIIAVAAIGLVIVFYVPSVHEKMFWKDTNRELTIQDLRYGNITTDDIRYNGRKALWKMLSKEFYRGHEMTGSGIGSCQKFLYEYPGTIKQPHNDYVQLLCDTGRIGAFLYIITGLAIILHCIVISFLWYIPRHVKCCAMIAASALAGNYLAMYSDNIVTYTMATTSYPFALYGIMLGMLSKVPKPTYQYSERGLNF